MYKKSFFQTFLFFIVVFLLHLGINSLLNQISITDIVLVHVVLFGLTFGGACLLIATSIYDPNKIGFAFLAVSTLKMLVSATLILVMIKLFDKPKPIGIHYAAVYFGYVLFLSYNTLKLLHPKKD